MPMARPSFQPTTDGLRRAVPPGRRVYAVGDVHGMIEPLRALLRAIAAHADGHYPAQNVLVCLGDYVDRGPDSRAVIDLLLENPLPGFDRVCLKGNHEEILLQFLVDAQKGPVWFANGGQATLASYGVRPPLLGADGKELERAQRELAERIPAAHLDFFRGLPLSHVEGDYIFVHAGLRPGIPIARQRGDDMMWIRDEFLYSDEEFGKLVVHGHSIAETPQIRPNRIGIDTGAFATGRLTCLVLEGTERAFLTS